ncbi:MAG: GHKL domain-containing protein [Clostridia bacterium]|nr:GHKL domain-containing protein [Clostridia bacterium]
MTKKIFRSIITVAMTVLLASLLLAFSFLYEYYSNLQVRQLKEELSLVAPYAQNAGDEYFENLESSVLRFTLVSPDGRVLYDTHADVSQMENHLDRDEIKSALQNGSGSSARYSATLTEKTFYEAVLLSNGNVLRVSVSQTGVGALILGILPAICAIILTATVVAMVLSHRMAKSIVKPLEKLDLENPTENNAYDELTPILTKIAFAERSRREFTANVSHELKTPLQSIIGSAELLQNGLVKPEDEEKFTGNIKKEAERLVNLINDIIRLSQLDENIQTPTETVGLLQVANEVKQTLMPSAQSRNITFTVSGEDCRIQGVRRYIYEIMYNLCDNAIRYNRDGGKVELDISKEDGNTVIKVSDTGIGIAPEHLPRVFERFYRVDKSHSKQTGGTGLGLSIVKHAVQYHGGKTEIESKQGEGTVIKVTL